jgi:hypothetical protein
MKRGQDSGQILVIAVLVVSLVLLSTQVYIYDVGRSLGETEASNVSGFVYAVKLGSKHVVTGSLANISRVGSGTVLSSNLEDWTSFVEGLYQFGRPILNFTLRDTLPYMDGYYVSWGTDGLGVTSSYVDFSLSLLDGQASVELPYTVNVTASVIIEGVYRRLVGDTMQINVTCHVSNEGVAALAENVTVLYEKSGVWLRADTKPTYNYTDYGNGTYLVSFEQDYQSFEAVNVSAQVLDLRGIYVQANATCSMLP